MSDDEIKLLTPNLDDCYQIAELWIKAGKYNKAGMQASQLTWSEIESFSKFNPITPMEADIIYEMGESFITGLNDTESRHPPTFDIMSKDERRDAVRSRVALQFEAIKKDIPKK